MQTVKILSDSTCDLSKELLEKYNVGIIPLHVVLGEGVYEDGVNITPDQIYQWVDENKAAPKTSAPSPDAIISEFQRQLEHYDEIVCFSIAAGMSSSNASMHLAAQELESEARIHIIDSANLSTGIGLLALEAAELAAGGAKGSEIVSHIEIQKPLVRSSFVVDTLMYLYRGGRCSGLSAFAGERLRLHPRIAVTDGAMSAGKKYRGKIDGVILKYVQDMEQNLLAAQPKRVFITHSGCQASTVAAVREYLQGLNHFEEICETRAGGVVTCHCGPGTLGVLYLDQKFYLEYNFHWQK